MTQASDAMHRVSGSPRLSAQAHVPNRIAYLLSRYPARSHTFFLQEVLGLRDRGIDVRVASVNAPDRTLEDLPATEASEARATFYIKSGSRVRHLLGIAFTAVTRPDVVLRGLRAIRRLSPLSLRQRLFWCLYLAEAIIVGRWMRREQLTHLHVHFGGAVASVGMLTSIVWRIPFSLTIHGPEELLDPAAFQLHAKLSKAAFVICISEFCREQLAALLPPREQLKLHIVRLGANVGQLAPVMKDAAVHEPLQVVCVGRLVPEKGHIVLLRAIALLHEQGLCFRTTLVGAGPELATLQQYVEAHGLRADVTFTSGLSHAQALEYVRCADIFALASFAEGVPVALMEAMSLGVPCLSTQIAGIPELIGNGESGWLVPPGDAPAFADALARLASDAALRRRLGEAGRAQVLRSYNLPKNLDLLANFLREHVFDRGATSASARVAALQQPAVRENG